MRGLTRLTIGHRAPLLAAAALSLGLGAVGAPVALAQGPPPPPPPPPTTPAPPPPAAPGRLALKLTGPVRVGRDLVALSNGRARVDATVTPYVAGQSVEAVVRRDGKVAQRRRVAIRPGPGGTGVVALSLPTARTGRITVEVSHAATAQQQAYSGRAPAFGVLASSLHAGARGLAVAVLQARLAGLGYAVPRNRVFDAATGRAVLAYRKVNNLGRTETADRASMERLLRNVGGFHVRYPRDGRHVEGDLRHQVLALVDGRRVQAVYTMSSGKPSTPTVLGRYRVYLKTIGTNSHGMVDSNYFYRGYAVHGYADVPTYAASHGCLRVPIPDASTIYGRIKIGEIVDVYY